MIEYSATPMNPHWSLNRVPGKQKPIENMTNSYTANMVAKNGEIEDDLWNDEFWKELKCAENIETDLVRLATDST